MNEQFTTRRLVAALAVVLTLAALPPLTAAWIAGARIARAERDVRNLAAAFRGLQLDERFTNIAVLVGPGDSPRLPDTSPWKDGPMAALTTHVSRNAGIPMDPWRKQYLVNVGAAARRRAGPIWVISAGPNRRLETPYWQPEPGSLSGDDIGARVR